MSDERNPLRGLRSVPPPGGLREPVLSAAREAQAAEAKPTIWDRVWESRALRLAWVGVTVGLVLGHVLVSIEPGKAGMAPEPDLARADRGADDLLEIVRLPRATRIAMDFEIAPREVPASVKSTDSSTHGGKL
jgi:hypothetical protein